MKEENLNQEVPWLHGYRIKKHEESFNLQSNHINILYNLLYSHTYETSFQDFYNHTFENSHNSLSPSFKNNNILIKKGTKLPQSWNKAYSARELDFFSKEIPILLKTGILKRTRSPANSPVVLVEDNTKENGYRMCVNYRKLNELSVTNSYPLPRIEEDIKRIPRGSKYFFKIDCKSGFWNIRTTPTSQTHYAFYVPKIGKLTWNVMPFGIKNGPADFQQFMEEILRGINCNIYIDDIWGSAKTLTELYEKITIIIKRLAENRIYINWEKSILGGEKVKILGFEISEEGLTMPKEKLEPIKRIQITNQKQLRKALGKANYYRKYIPNFSAHTRMFWSKLRKGKPFKWNTRDETKWRKFMQTLSKPITTGIGIDPNKEIIIKADASNMGCAAFLINDGKIIDHISSGYTKTQDNYSIAEKECLALVLALDRFDYYIYNNEFTIQTDNKAVSEIIKKGDSTNKRLARWSLKFMGKKFKIKLVKSKENYLADWESRNI